MPQKNRNIKSANSPARKHVRFLMIMERQASLAYRIVMKRMIDEIKYNLRSEKLMKSDKRLKSGWTGEVPTIRVNLSNTVTNTVQKYMKALRWILLGDYAGKDARKVAKDIGLVDKFVPGVIQSSYLDALDKHNEHFKNVADNIENIPDYLVRESLEKVTERTNRYLNQVATQLENTMTQAVDRIFERLTDVNNISAGKQINEGLEDIDIREEIPKSWVDKELREVANNFRTNWDRTVKGEVGLASAAATHQSVMETFGSDPDTKVVLLTSKDERVCKFCNNLSMHPDGTFKYYKPKDFKPSGWNIGKKRDQWSLCWPSLHINCRCFAVVVPYGFSVRPDGQLVIE